MDASHAVAALAALAQETRLAVFRRLVAAGPAGLSAGHIADSLAVPAATLSFHLKELRGAGLITRRKCGRSLIYAADYRGIEGLVGFLLDNCCRQPAGGQALEQRTPQP